MRRFIRYLYEYEQEKKMRNVGFVKVEQDVDQCVIHVHGKGFRMEENAQGLRAYLFWNTEDKCIGIPQGVTEVPGPAVNWQLCYTPEDVGKKENYNLVNGIILKDVNGHWYAAVWNDDVVNVCRMEMWKMEEDSVQGEEPECKKGLAQDEEPECKKETLQDEESESGKLEDDLEKEACLGGKVRKEDVQTVYVYCHCAHPYIHFCGRTLPVGGKEFYQVLCRSVSGRGDYCACLYYFFRVFCQSAGHWGYVLKRSDDCVELCGRIGVQLAGTGRCGKSI